MNLKDNKTMMMSLYQKVSKWILEFMVDHKNIAKEAT